MATRMSACLPCLVVALGLWLAAQPAVHAQARDPTLLTSFQHCLEGTASDWEAGEVGAQLVKPGYPVTFDTAAFAPSCADEIATRAFNVDDEKTSLVLVTRFWSDRFLDRFYEASFIEGKHLSCDLTCLLTVDRRPLPSFALFKKALAGLKDVPESDRVLLFTRALITRLGQDLQTIRPLLASLPPDLRKQVVTGLYVMGSAGLVATLFDRRGDGAKICLAEDCIEATPIAKISDCRALLAHVNELANKADLIAFKSWLIGEGRELAGQCVAADLDGPIEKVWGTSARLIYELYVFNPEIEFTDIVNGYRSGLFKSFDLADDVSRLANLRLSHFQGASATFAGHIVEQLATASADAWRSSEAAEPQVAASLGSTPSGARYAYLVCRRRAQSDGRGCDQKRIYLSAMRRFLP